MADISTNNYNYYGSERVLGSSGGTSYSKDSSNELDVNDFMKIFCTELTNQNILSSDSSSSGGSTDYISQLAQFTTLQTMKTMTEIIYAQYGATMVGKDVVVASTDSLGKYSQDTGAVEGVTLTGGDVQIKVNGKLYPMSAVMEVVSGKSKDDNSTTDTSKDENTTDKPEA